MKEAIRRQIQTSTLVNPVYVPNEYKSRLKICIACGTPYLVSLKKTISKSKYCSRKCSNKNQVKGGWKGNEGDFSNVADSWFLDPLFWQALGKAMGWGKGKLMRPAISDFRCAKCGADEKDIEMQMDEVKYHQYRFIDHLAEGKDAESFFNELLK